MELSYDFAASKFVLYWLRSARVTHLVRWCRCVTADLFFPQFGWWTLRMEWSKIDLLGALTFDVSRKRDNWKIQCTFRSMDKFDNRQSLRTRWDTLSSRLLLCFVWRCWSIPTLFVRLHFFHASAFCKMHLHPYYQQSCKLPNRKTHFLLSAVDADDSKWWWRYVRWLYGNWCNALRMLIYSSINAICMLRNADDRHKTHEHLSYYCLLCVCVCLCLLRTLNENCCVNSGRWYAGEFFENKNKLFGKKEVREPAPHRKLNKRYRKRRRETKKKKVAIENEMIRRVLNIVFFYNWIVRQWVDRHQTERRQ